jgi:hypothetical protein
MAQSRSQPGRRKEEVNSRFTGPAFVISLCLLFILALCCVGQAQSGRRSSKPPSPPTPTPAEAEQPSTPKDKPAEKQRTLIAGMSDELGAAYIPGYMSDDVWRGFLDRFKAYSSIMLSTEKRMSRKQAIDRAKKETESFVVLLQLGTEDLNVGLGGADVNDLVVSYLIFAPGTAKIKDQGHVYLRSYRGVLGTRLPTGQASTQLFEAGREAASRVLSDLDIPNPVILR